MNRLFLLVTLGATVFSGAASAQYMNAKSAPCRNVVVTADAAKCFSSAAKEADQKLNRFYGKIQTFLESEKRTEDLDALRKAERLWIVYRDANCAAARGLYDGGTGGPVNYLACMESQTRARAEDLMTGYGPFLDK